MLLIYYCIRVKQQLHRDLNIYNRSYSINVHHLSRLMCNLQLNANVTHQEENKKTITKFHLNKNKLSYYKLHIIDYTIIFYQNADFNSVNEHESRILLF